MSEVVIEKVRTNFLDVVPFSAGPSCLVCSRWMDCLEEFSLFCDTFRSGSPGWWWYLNSLFASIIFTFPLRI